MPDIKMFELRDIAMIERCQKVEMIRARVKTLTLDVLFDPR